MAKKPQITNIRSSAERRGPDSPTQRLMSQLSELHSLWKQEHDHQFLDFFPTRIVTIVEVYIKSIIKELVDTGTPYLDRCGPIMKPINIDIDYLAAISGKLITVGDLVSHTVSINNFEQIISNLTTILGTSFRQDLENVHDRISVELMGNPVLPIISDFQKLANDISRLFEIRHIIIHEAPLEKPYEITEIDGYFESSSALLNAIDQLVATQLHGNYPLTQSDINMASFSELQIAEAEMNRLLTELISLENVDILALNDTQKAWDNFANLYAKYIASDYEGGSMQSMILSSAKKDLAETRSDQFKQLLVMYGQR